MTHYVYIFINTPKDVFNVGYSSDIKRTILFYSGLPMYRAQIGYRQNILVWVGSVSSEEKAVTGMNKIMAMNKAEKLKLIESLNPNFEELIQGKNFAL